MHRDYGTVIPVFFIKLYIVTSSPYLVGREEGTVVCVFQSRVT